MTVYFVAAALLILYTAAVPVKFALILHLSARPAFAAGTAAFEGRFAQKRALKRIEGKQRSRKKRKHRAGTLADAFHAGKYLLQHTRLEQFIARGRISFGDAGSTALAWGIINGISGMLAPVCRVRMQLEPDFSSGQSDLLICGMFSVPLGHIIATVLIRAWMNAKRRLSHGKASD